MSETNYRPDIDGLRAISILAVIAYHAFPSIFPGGYIGVDIFFVISGFLISSILFTSLENNDFSYLDFYSRRIMRIFPALFTVLLAAWLFGWLVLFPDEFILLGKHIVSGIYFVSNLTFLSEVGYFDRSAETKPLLHLWSLGVEEQFYIFWPVFLWLVRNNKSGFLRLTGALAVASFAYCLFTTYGNSPSAAFYLPTTRFWEIMTGGLLAYIFLHRQEQLPRSGLVANLWSLAGILLLASAFLLIDRDSMFPGVLATLPVAGAFLLIASPSATINRSLLSRQWLVYVGLISYPLYLWHWLVLSYVHILGWTASTPRLLAVLLSFLLAIGTFELIEKPLRRHRTPKTVGILLLLAVLISALGLTVWGGHPSPRNSRAAQKLAAEATNDWEYPPRSMEKVQMNGIDLYIQRGTQKQVLFWGDSHIEQYAPRISWLAETDPIRTKTAIFATRGGCLPIPHVYEDRHTSCNQTFKDTVSTLALSRDIDAVVIGASWGRLIPREKPAVGEFRYYYLRAGEKIYFDAGGIELALKELEALLTDLTRSKKVFLVIDNPTDKSFDPKSLIGGSRLSGVPGMQVQTVPYARDQAAIRELLLEMAQRTKARVIDPVAHLCAEDQCRNTLPDGTPIYKDSSHLRADFVRKHIDYLDSTVR